MPNRLAEETSPYLRQHADNPVDWYPWGEDARSRAREIDRPILLSIGYSSCHWCHVMAHESFEDEAMATYLNEHFVAVKVDREERPDVDAIQMEALQAQTGHGGWPLTAFCDPDGVPFHSGTYFPDTSRGGMPSFRVVCEAVVDAWQTKREEIRERAPRVRESLAGIARTDQARTLPGRDEHEAAIAALRERIDPVNGGFGGAPKFPPASALELLLSSDGAEAEVRLTLDRIAFGGIRDQLAGGFARYSVDAEWLVPHFEKMLYDNALLARAYLHGWQRTGEPRYRDVCVETLEWALAEMRGPEGGFMAALDADSEGEEGRFYVWSRAEAIGVLAAAGLESTEAEAVLAHLGVSERGNFEGANVLHLPRGDGDPPPRLDEARRALLAARAGRVRPGLDDKRICSWNALMIAALADAGAVLGREDLIDAAGEAADFVLSELRGPDGRLLRTWKDGTASLDAYLEDHAFLLEALLALYEASFEPRWFDAAREIADAMIERFSDPDRGGFFTTAADQADAAELIARRKDLDDHPIPSGSSSAAYGLLRLAALSGEGRYAEHAEATLRLFAGIAVRHPQALAHMLRALDLALGPVRELALIGSRAEVRELERVVRAEFRPRLVLASGEPGATEPPLLAERDRLGGSAAAYLCEAFSCQAPTDDPRRLELELNRLSG